MLHRVKDLSPEQRTTIETLLGRAIAEDEAVSIKGIRPYGILASELSLEERTEAVEKLNRYFAKVDAKRQSVSVEEEEAIINDALRSTRPGYRPVH
jgi:hypothetical protein